MDPCPPHGRLVHWPPADAPLRLAAVALCVCRFLCWLCLPRCTSPMAIHRTALSSSRSTILIRTTSASKCCPPSRRCTACSRVRAHCHAAVRCRSSCDTSRSRQMRPPRLDPAIEINSVSNCTRKRQGGERVRCAARRSSASIAARAAAVAARQQRTRLHCHSRSRAQRHRATANTDMRSTPARCHTPQAILLPLPLLSLRVGRR